MPMKITSFRYTACCLLLVMLPLFSNARNASSALDGAKMAINHAHLQRLVSCLVGDKSFSTYALKFDNLKIGESAKAKSTSGSIVDESYDGEMYNIILYSADGKRAAIGTVASGENGAFEVVQNGYLLKVRGNSWVVEEGEGGYHDYAKVVKLMESLSQSPGGLVHIIPQSNACLLKEKKGGKYNF